MLDAVSLIPKLLCRLLMDFIAIVSHKKELLDRQFRYGKDTK